MAQKAAKRQGQGARYAGLDAAERARQRRTAVLSAALELFASQGYPATSVKQICRQAGLTERYFYESFSDRHACLVALYGELADQLRTATAAAIEESRGLDLDEVTRRALAAFIDHLASDPRRARVVLLEAVGASSEMEDRRHAVLREFSALATAVWLDDAPPTTSQRLAVVGLVGAVNHLLVDWLHRGRQETQEELVDVCTTLFSAVRRRLLPEERSG